MFRPSAVRKPILIGLACVVVLFEGSTTVGAQQASRAYRIGFVSPISPGPTIAAFRQGLTEVGYIEGKNLLLEARFAEGRIERLPELVAEVLRLLVVGSPDGAVDFRSSSRRASTW